MLPRPSLRHTAQLAQTLVTSGEISSAVVRASSASGETVSYALGMASGGEAASTDSRVFSYCAIKPVVACAVLAACDEAGLDPRVEVLDSAELGVTTGERSARFALTDLLAHQVGLQEPLILHTLAAEQTTYPSLVSAGVERSSSAPRAEFSEVSAGELLIRFLARLRGKPTRVAYSEMIERAGISGIGPGDLGSLVVPCLVPLWEGPGMGVPMYLTSLAAFADHARPAVGSYMSVAELHLWWQRLCAHLRGDRVSSGADGAGRIVEAVSSSKQFPQAGLLAEMTADARDASDASLDTRAPYGAGFMVELRRHGWSSDWGPASLAHHGGGAALAGWCDPAAGRSAAAFTGRFWLDPTRRDSHLCDLTAAVARDLDELDL